MRPRTTTWRRSPPERPGRPPRKARARRCAGSGPSRACRSFAPGMSAERRRAKAGGTIHASVTLVAERPTVLLPGGPRRRRLGRSVAGVAAVVGLILLGVVAGVLAGTWAVPPRTGQPPGRLLMRPASRPRLQPSARRRTT